MAIFRYRTISPKVPYSIHQKASRPISSVTEIGKAVADLAPRNEITSVPSDMTDSSLILGDYIVSLCDGA